MRILRRKGKWKEITNALNIPEVNKYNYLGIITNQSLKLQDHEDKIRAIEKFIGIKAKLLERIIEKTKGKRLILEIIF